MSLKNNKYARRLAAALMTGTMMVSMLGMTAMAENNPQNVTITKQITKDANFYAPKTTFTFTIEPGTAVSAKENGGVEIYRGVDGGAVFSEGAGTITSAPQPSDIGETTITAGTTKITVNEDKFDKPGIYRYVVTEAAGDYEGVTYSTESKNFDVYVNTNGEVYAYTFTDEAADNGKDDGIFTNDYSKKPEDETTPHDLTITKKVTGNQGSKSEPFDFEITVNGVDGEQYYVTYGDNENITLTSGQEGTIQLKADQSATIYGLTKGDAYTVTEIAANEDGYTTKIDEKDTTDGTITGNVVTNDVTHNYTNDRQVSTPTGVILNIAPYILMVALAGVLAFFFLRKRRYDL